MPQPFPLYTVETTHLIDWQDPPATVAPTLSLGWQPRRWDSELQRRVTACYVQLRALPRRVRRAVQRKLALPLAGVALLLALGQAPSQAATIAVDGTTCTLVDAITAANTDTAQGGCPAGSRADTLVLEPPGSTVTLSSVNNIAYGPTGLPVIRSHITIAGQGGTIARAPSAPAFRLLAVNRAGDLTLQDATLTGGSAVANFSLVGLGAGVLNYNGAVSIENSAVTGNTGSGVGTLADDGGRTTVTLTKSTISQNSGTGVSNGVESRGSYQEGAATVTITESTITGNGLGISNTAASNLFHGPGDATVTVTRSTISDNRGGGVSNRVGQDGGIAAVTLIQSTVSGNGGAGVHNSIYLYYSPGGSSVTINQSTISGNSGGGVRNFGDRAGTATIALTESTISGNTTTYNGGGVYNHGYLGGAVVTLVQSTLTGNTAGGKGGGIWNYGYSNYGDATVTLAGSLVTGNWAPTAPEVSTEGGDLAIITANAFNLFGVSGTVGIEGFTPGPTDRVPSEPLTAILDPVLADHGGPTLTHALVPGSPAIDAISWGSNGCGTTFFSDQRGVSRPQGAGCDIGAFELAGTPPPDEFAVCILQLHATGEVLGTVMNPIAVVVPSALHTQVPVPCPALATLALGVANQEPFAVRVGLAVFSQQGTVQCTQEPFILPEQGARKVVFGSDCVPASATRSTGE